MTARLVLVFSFLTACIAAGPLFAQRTPIIAEGAAARHGLTRSWMNQAQFNPSRDRVESVVLDLLDKPSPDGSAHDILLVQSNHGMLHAFDANTGRTLWAAQIGDRLFAHSTPSANDMFVAVMAGSTVYIIDRADGSPVWETVVKHIPTQTVTLGPNHLHVPSISGHLTAYDLPRPRQEGGWEMPKTAGRAYQSFGRIDIQPIVTPRSVAWATSRGHLYFATLNQSDVRFRFDTRESVQAPLGYWPPLVFVASRDGYVYALSELNGLSPWRFAAGHAINETPAVIAGVVYLLPEVGGMHALAADTGAELWYAPKPHKLVSASSTRVYTTDRYGNLLILDAKTGGELDRLETAEIKHKLLNTYTDRLYLTTETGLVQCLHERGLDVPFVNVLPGLPEKAPAAVPVEAAPVETPAEDAEETEVEEAEAEDAEGDEEVMEEEGEATEEGEEEADADAEVMEGEDAAEDADPEDPAAEETEADPADAAAEDAAP